MKKNPSYERYQRQIVLKEFGLAGQQQLMQARVLVVGAGGLGCPVLQYLAAAGVGTIGIIDDDVVSLANLHRQVIYTMEDIDLLKAERAAIRLQQLNPEIRIDWYAERLQNQNALDLFSAYDIIVDGTDNFASRYLINDACVLLGKPLVYGAISRFEGQVAVFNVVKNANETTANYRDLFPDPPLEGSVLNCADAGVLGVLPGIIGSLQAAEVIKLITGIGTVTTNTLLTYNVLTCQLFEMAILPSVRTLAYLPKDEAAFLKTDYEWLCSATGVAEITAEQFSNYLQDRTVTIIDVREWGELPQISDFLHQHIPLAQLQNQAKNITGETIITFCQSGKRSAQAATLLLPIFGASKKIYSLKGGIGSWKALQQRAIK
jgi:adenylyltransferase/sulfurtransferase